MNPITFHFNFLKLQYKNQENVIKSFDQLYIIKKEGFKESFNKNGKFEDYEFLYEPIKYYIFGSYDIAFVSLINNFNFAQKLQTPVSQNSFSYYTHTGVLEGDFQAKDFKKLRNYGFVLVSNLKLNNRFLIGNGNIFIKSIIKIIEREFENIKDIKVYILRTYTWNELSLIIYTNKLENTFNILESLKEKTINSLENSEEIITNSVCFNEENFLKHKNDYLISDLISDTQTIIGINYDIFNKKSSDKSLQRLFNLNTEFEFETEWNVKPGHLKSFNDALSKKIPRHNLKVTNGRYDYSLSIKLKSLEQLYNLHSLIKKNPAEINKHSRFKKTKFYFNSIVNNENFKLYEKHNLSSNIKGLTELLKLKVDEAKINENLKKLMISKALRDLTIKTIRTYQNCTEDSILSIYFLDLFTLVKNFLSLIENYIDGNKTIPVDYIEIDITNFISNFQKCYDVRYYSTYTIDDSVDDNIDFSSSQQQIYSSYITISNQFINNLATNLNPNSFYYIIQPSNRSTSGNIQNTFLSVMDIMYPEFSFFIISRESITKLFSNSNQSENNNYFKLNNSIKKITEILKDNNNKNFNFNAGDLIKSKVISIKDMMIEAVHFNLFYGQNFKLYETIYWSIVVKDSGNYVINGDFKEVAIHDHIIRLLFVKEFCGLTDEILCPLPQMEDHWRRVYENAKKEIKDIILKFKPTSLYNEIQTNIELIRKEYSNKVKGTEFEKFITYNINYSLNIFDEFIKNRISNQNYFLSDLFIFRSWDKNEIIKFRNRSNNNYYYLLNQFGDVFFDNYKKQNDYFVIRNECLDKWVDYSLKFKKEDILKFSKDGN